MFAAYLHQLPAGVVIELDHSTPIIVYRPLYRELAKGAIKRTVEELREQAERAKTERKQAASWNALGSTET